MPKTKSEGTRYPILIPDDLYEDIKRMAGEDTRTIHGQIIALLKEAVVARKEKPAHRS